MMSVHALQEVTRQLARLRPPPRHIIAAIAAFATDRIAKAGRAGSASLEAARR
jgi:hypothetical protein